ncbi:hypothetical protein ACTMU2_24255 [Cupriavidus basilensis]
MIVQGRSGSCSIINVVVNADAGGLQTSLSQLLAGRSPAFRVMTAADESGPDRQWSPMPSRPCRRWTIARGPYANAAAGRCVVRGRRRQEGRRAEHAVGRYRNR